jgi:hypothetical protein
MVSVADPELFFSDPNPKVGIRIPTDPSFQK